MSQSNTSQVPSYAQPTISFSRHHNFKPMKKKMVASKSKTERFFQWQANDAYSKAEAKSAKPFAKASTLSRLRLRNTAGNSDLRDLFKETSSGNVYSSIYSATTGKENHSVYFRKENCLNKPTPYNDPFATYDDDKENNYPKNNHTQPILRKDISNNDSKRLRLRYERPPSSEILSPGINSFLTKYYQSCKSTHSADSVFPTVFLKSLVKGKESVAAQSWYDLVDILSSITNNIFESQNADFQYTESLAVSLQQKVIQYNSVFEKTIESLTVLRDSLEKHKDGADLDAISKQLHDIAKQMQQDVSQNMTNKGTNPEIPSEPEANLESPSEPEANLESPSESKMTSESSAEIPLSAVLRSNREKVDGLILGQSMLGLNSCTGYLDTKNNDVLKLFSPLQSKNVDPPSPQVSQASDSENCEVASLGFASVDN